MVQERLDDSHGIGRIEPGVRKIAALSLNPSTGWRVRGYWNRLFSPRLKDSTPRLSSGRLRIGDIGEHAGQKKGRRVSARHP